MRLLYIWIEKYKCFENQEFNFSSEGSFSYDKIKMKLEYKKNEGYIENFFNSGKVTTHSGIKEVTAIVGNNGSGKSTLLRLIMDLSDISAYAPENKFLLLLMDECGEIRLATNDDRIIKSADDWIDEIQNLTYHKISKNNYLQYLVRMKYIYHTNLIDYNYYMHSGYSNVHDISTTGLMRRDKSNLYEQRIKNLDIDTNYVFFNADFYRQIEFVYKFNNSNEYIPFRLPKEINVAFSDLNSVREGMYRRINTRYIDEGSKDNDKDVETRIQPEFSLEDKLLANLHVINNKFNDLLTLDNKEGEPTVDIFKLMMLQGIYLNIISRIIPSTVGGNEEKKYNYIHSNIQDYIIKELNNIKNVVDFWNLISKFIINIKNSNVLDIDDKEISSYINALDIFDNKIDKSFLTEIQYYTLTNRFTLKVTDDQDGVTDKLINLKNFYNVYKDTATYFNYLEFSWLLSSGENNLLSLFSRFYSLIDKSKGEIKNTGNGFDMTDITVLIDEADMSLHPEWQRRYISSLIRFLKYLYGKNRIHIIFTTHSPILLSDIPNNNIIYLLKDNKNQIRSIKKDTRTFGANIYNLYTDGFYFKSDFKSNRFGIIGEFATEYILGIEGNLDSMLNKDYSEINNELELCKKGIDLIGEKVITELLNEKYYNVKSMIMKNKNDGLDNAIREFDKLTMEDKKRLIKYILEDYRK